MRGYSIWALECAYMPKYPDSALLYGASGGERQLPFVYWILQSEDHTVLVDAGMNDGEWCRGQFEAYNVVGFQPPGEVLGRIGVRPEDVDTIVMTHHHFDHISGLRYFPNANVYIQRREVENWFAKWGVTNRMKWLAGGLDPDTGRELAAIGGEGRLRMVEGVADVVEGIHVRPAFNSHTEASQYIVLEPTDGRPWVFTGDVAYLYDNLGGLDGDGQLVPVGLAQGSQEGLIRATDQILTLAGDRLDRVIPSHEARLWDLFPSVEHDDGLHVAELTLADGASSRIGSGS